jgi:hypothetical protein
LFGQYQTLHQLPRAFAAILLCLVAKVGAGVWANGAFVFLPTGDTVIVEGQSSRGVFTPCSGRAKLSFSSGNEKSRMCVTEPGEILRLSAVLRATNKEQECCSQKNNLPVASGQVIGTLAFNCASINSADSVRKS